MDETPDRLASANGHALVLETGLPPGYDDDDLTAAELADEAGWGADAAPGDDAIVRLEARVDALVAAQAGRRVHRKVTASVLGAALAAAAPALLQALDAVELSPSLQPLSMALTAAIGAFVAGYATPEREATSL